MKRLLAVVLIFIAQKSFAKAFSESIQHEKGLISLSFFAGSQENRLLNQDASYSSLNGWQGGASLDIAVYSGNGGGQLRLFGSYTFSELKDKFDESVTVTKNEMLYGAKAYVSPWLFLGVGYGQSEQKFSSSTDSISTRNNLLAGGIGVEYGLSDSWSMGLQGWYKMNPIAKQPESDGNSFSDGYDLSLVLTWSPPTTTITRQSK
jgi:hypothetical protein